MEDSMHLDKNPEALDLFDKLPLDMGAQRIGFQVVLYDKIACVYSLSEMSHGDGRWRYGAASSDQSFGYSKFNVG